eukprot:GFYU01002714.1.p2 GENE.GFYU01002714.1~~GFYU01002714.1.p2  ORF type:complete len:427 (-),score=130.84 GFYU01002714.1:35-1315(-)
MFRRDIVAVAAVVAVATVLCAVSVAADVHIDARVTFTRSVEDTGADSAGFSGQCASTGHVEGHVTCTNVLNPGFEHSTEIRATEQEKDIDLNQAYIDSHVFAYDRSAKGMQVVAGRAKVGAYTMGSGSKDDAEEFEARVVEALGAVDKAGALGLDAFLLPEEFAGFIGQKVPDGDLTRRMAEKAKKYNMYVVFGIRETGDDGLAYNTDVLLGRNGEFIGKYRKLYPCCPPPGHFTPNEDVHPGDGGVQVWDLDFGRVAMLTCFDANFMEAWHEAYAKKADLIFWPSAYGGGMALRAYAQLYHYVIVPNGWGDITDKNGKVVENLQNPEKNMWWAEVDLDKTYIHVDYTEEKRSKMLDDYKGLIEVDPDPLIAQSNFVLIKTTDLGYNQGIRVRQLLREYDIEPLRDYQQRSREVVNKHRQNGSVVI